MNASTCLTCQRSIPADAPGGLCPSCALRGAERPTSFQFEEDLPSDEEVAAAFPDLEILGVIGRGGMGVVYRARQPRLDRLVALKILPPHLAARPGFAERFTREARTLAKLSHPHIVGVHDFGESGGYFYLLMEYVDGVNLRQAMSEGITPEQALRLVPKICEALQFAHDRGVLHRDIKPENILLDRAGAPKLADFGIAKLVEDGMRTLTVSGAALGTVAYMAPEQLEKPATVDHRADIFSIGVVLYEMLTGELPLGRFGAPSEKARVGEGVDAVVLRALEKERDRRQQSAVEMKTQVEGVSREVFVGAVPGDDESDGSDGLRGLFALASALAVVGIPASRVVPVMEKWGLTAPVMIFASVAFGLLSVMWPGARRIRPRASAGVPSGPSAPVISSCRIFGYPLWHIEQGSTPDPRTGRHRVARGILAIGPEARGFFAIGGRAHGVVALGGLATGVVACGGVAGGLISAGGLSIGLLGATGGLAVGGIARGGAAVGFDTYGGIAVGRLAQGGLSLTDRPDGLDPFSVQVVEFLVAAIQGVGLACGIGILTLLLCVLLGIGTTPADGGRRRRWPALIVMTVTAACALLMWELKRLNQSSPVIRAAQAGPKPSPEVPEPLPLIIPEKPATTR